MRAVCRCPTCGVIWSASRTSACATSTATAPPTSRPGAASPPAPSSTRSTTSTASSSSTGWPTCRASRPGPSSSATAKTSSSPGSKRWSSGSAREALFMTEFWCEHAWLGGEEAHAGVLIGVEGERIVTVRVGVAEAPAGAVVLSGSTIPGLANAHSHAFQRAFRGKTEVGRGTFWTWRERMYEAAARLDPDSYFTLARATFGEMALAGVTAVGEFHYVHHAPDGSPYEDPNAMGAAVIAAAREAGIRITLLDTCYLHGGVGSPLSDGQRRFSDGTVERWVDRVE